MQRPLLAARQGLRAQVVGAGLDVVDPAERMLAETFVGHRLVAPVVVGACFVMVVEKFVQEVEEQREVDCPRSIGVAVQATAVQAVAAALEMRNIVVPKTGVVYLVVEMESSSAVGLRPVGASLLYRHSVCGRTAVTVVRQRDVTYRRWVKQGW